MKIKKTRKKNVPDLSPKNGNHASGFTKPITLDKNLIEAQKTSANEEKLCNELMDAFLVKREWNASGIQLELFEGQQSLMVSIEKAKAISVLTKASHYIKTQTSTAVHLFQLLSELFSGRYKLYNQEKILLDVESLCVSIKEIHNVNERSN